MNACVISTTFVIYIIILLLIGLVAYRRTHNLADYVLGGRRIGAWVAAISAGASDMSGWLLLGLPGYAYVSGLQAAWLVIGLWLGGYFNWVFVARRLRVYSEFLSNSLTIPEFLNQRFADRNNHIRILAALTTVVFFVLYTVSGLVASGKLFNSVFGLPYEWAILLGVTAIVTYTFIGGFLAVSWTDLFQGILMLMALVLVPMVILFGDSIPSSIGSRMPMSESPFFGLFDGDDKAPLGWFGILSLLAWGLGYFGQPHILARFKAIRHPNDLNAARRIAVSWSGLAMVAAVAVGLLGYAYFNPGPGLSDPERVFIVLVEQTLPAVIAGICLAAILAAIMSTADSQLLVSASVLTEDLYRLLRKQSVSDRHLMWVGRWVVVSIAAIATALALNPDNTVLGFVAYAWAGFGASFGPVLLFSLYWRAMTRTAALAGMVSGAMTVIIWKQLEGGIFDLYEMLPGVGLSCVSIVIVGRWLSRPDPVAVSGFDEFRRRLKALEKPVLD